MIKKYLKFATLTLMVGILSIGNSSCGGNREDSKRDSDSVAVQQNPIPGESEKGVQNVKVYFDNSASMEGYVSKGAISKGNDFLNIVNALGQDFVDSEKFSAEFCCIEKGNKKVKSGISFKEFSQMIQKGNIAKGEDSPLSTIISNIASKSSKGTLSVLFTDGILSGTNEEVAKSADRKFNVINIDVLKSKLRNELKGKNISASIYRFGNIPFVGEYYHYNNSHDTKSTYRPLFAIVLGSKEDVNEFKNWVESSTNVISRANDQMHIIESLPIKSGLTCPGIGIKNSEISVSHKNLIDKKDKYLTLKLPVKTFSGIYRKDYDFSSLANAVSVKLNGHDVNNPKGKDGVDGKAVVSYDVNDKAFVINIHANILEKENKLDVKISYSLPSWINEYTTTDDIKSYSNSSTFMVNKFLEGISEGISNGNVIDTLFDQELTINIKK